MFQGQIKSEIRVKGEHIGKFVQNLEADAKAIDCAIQSMAARKAAIESRVQQIKTYLLRNMQQADILKIECPYFKISRQKNPAKVVIDDEKLIPISYWRQPPVPPPPEPKPDKKEILDDLKQGVVIEGVHLEQNERLVIK